MNLSDISPDILTKATEIATDYHMNRTEKQILVLEVAKALAEERESNWRPISTAPKDGTKILLFTVWDDKEDAAFYGAEPFTATQIGCWSDGNGLDPQDDFYRPAEWECQLIGTPTHWMPLPEPPKGGA